MKTAVIDSNGIVKNLVVASADWTPPDGLVLTQVNNWINPGDRHDALEPPPPAPAIAPQLTDLDTKSIRAIRSILVAQSLNQTPNPQDIVTLQSHETAAQNLRRQL